MEAYFESDLIIKEIPKDNDGYVKSFSKDELENIKQFLDEYGFVVIRDVLDEEFTKRCVDDVWDYIENEKFRHFQRKNRSEQKTVSRNDPETWNSDNGWDTQMSSEGIIGIPAVFTKTALETRQNKALFEIGNYLQGTKSTLVSMDRYGCFRPTGLPEAKGEWRTLKNVHIDMNPWIYYSEEGSSQSQNWLERSFYSTDFKKGFDYCAEFNQNGSYKDPFVKIQAQFNFIDNLEENGGFLVIPGMHRALKDWQKFTERTIGRNYTGLDSFIMFHAETKEFYSQKDPSGIYRYAQRITSRAGSLILWNQLCPHGSAPNLSKQLRMAHFFKLYNQDRLSKQAQENRAKTLYYQFLKSQFEPNELGTQIFGLHVLSEETKQLIKQEYLKANQELQSQIEQIKQQFGLDISQQ